MCVRIWGGWFGAPQKHQWEPSWQDEVAFELDEEMWSYSERLFIEKDRYKIRCHGCTGGGIRERGSIAFENGQLLLHAQGAPEIRLALSGQPDGWVLSGGGKRYTQSRPSVPRIRPSAEGFQEEQPLELEGLQLGMKAFEVIKSYPRHLYQDGTLVCFVEGARRKFHVEFDGQGRVCKISGDRLSQSGRPLLNERSTQSDAEVLLGRLVWKSREHGWLEASRGSLRLESAPLEGELAGERRISRLCLSR